MGQGNFSLKFRAAVCKRQQASDHRRSSCCTPSSRNSRVAPSVRLEPEWTFLTGPRRHSRTAALQLPWLGAALRPDPTATWEGRRLGRRQRLALPTVQRQGREAPPSAPARPRSLSAVPLRGCPAGSVPMSSPPPQLHFEKCAHSLKPNSGVHKTFADAPHNKK